MGSGQGCSIIHNQHMISSQLAQLIVINSHECKCRENAWRFWAYRPQSHICMCRYHNRTFLVFKHGSQTFCQRPKVLGGQLLSWIKDSLFDFDMSAAMLQLGWPPSLMCSASNTFTSWCTLLFIFPNIYIISLPTIIAIQFLDGGGENIVKLHKQDYTGMAMVWFYILLIDCGRQQII